jgi:hypothetical protein
MVCCLRFKLRFCVDFFGLSNWTLAFLPWQLFWRLFQKLGNFFSLQSLCHCGRVRCKQKIGELSKLWKNVISLILKKNAKCLFLKRSMQKRSQTFKSWVENSLPGMWATSSSWGAPEHRWAHFRVGILGCGPGATTFSIIVNKMRHSA